MANESSTLPRVTFQTPEKPEEESSHRKLGKLTVKYNRKDLQRWRDLEEWIDAQLQELYQYQVGNWGELDLSVGVTGQVCHDIFF